MKYAVTSHLRARDGTKTYVTDFELKDDTKSIKVSAWAKQAILISRFPVGTKVKLENVFSKQGFKGESELSTISSTVIEQVS